MLDDWLGSLLLPLLRPRGIGQGNPGRPQRSECRDKGEDGHETHAISRRHHGIDGEDAGSQEPEAGRCREPMVRHDRHRTGYSPTSAANSRERPGPEWRPLPTTLLSGHNSRRGLPCAAVVPYPGIRPLAVRATPPPAGVPPTRRCGTWQVRLTGVLRGQLRRRDERSTDRRRWSGHLVVPLEPPGANPADVALNKT